MESQPQNPEFRNNPENFHQLVVSYDKLKNILNNNICSLSSKAVNNKRTGSQPS